MFGWLDRVFDHPVMMALNHLSQASWLVDMVIVKFMMLDTVKILPIVTAVVAAALMQTSRSRINHTFVTALGGSFIAIFVARIAQNISERPRPIFSGMEGFQVPYGTELDIPADWSSFPSDTSALAFALATAVFFRSRLLGTACLIWALAVTSFPRVYAGYHYPSDILGGALIGVLSAIAVEKLMPQRLLLLGETVMRRSRPVYYGAIFVVMYMTATMFFDVRQTLDAAQDVLFDEDEPVSIERAHAESGAALPPRSIAVHALK